MKVLGTASAESNFAGPFKRKACNVKNKYVSL